tara:strand:- start:26086 stop:26562 length:477 start_codon:yes stop_codon:yes gene_type:complete
MTIDGNSTGDSNAAVDGSITPVRFYVQPPPNLKFELVQVSIEVSDSGLLNIDSYGNVAGPLANGIQFFTIFNGVEKLDLNPFRSNRQLITLGPTVTQVPFAGNVNVNTYSFNVWEHIEQGPVISGNNNDRFGVIIQDDLRDLMNHTITVKGNMRIESI